ncbi:MAG: sulfatase, partial [Verrucomicrobiota bacterium]
MVNLVRPIIAWLLLALFATAQEKPNVLFLAVDDLNDWVGCLGGHPQAKTPHIDRLAASGVLFDNAHCAAPLCHPSRTATLTGLRPSTTGIYGNKAWFREHPMLKNWVTLPQYFRQHGYRAETGGKIYHHPKGEWSDPISWDRQYSIKMATPFPLPDQRYAHGMREELTNPVLARLIDWSPIEASKEQTADWQTAEGAAEFLGQDHDKPFFLACGIYRPHLQWYAPQEFFDLHPLDQVQLPTVKESDIADVPPVGKQMAAGAFDVIAKHGEWKRAVQGYLAATSFADACVGRVLEALESSSYCDNTIVVFWSDHGYQIGQKSRFAKSALWQQATRVPLVIRLSGHEANGSRCSRPVSLIDLYPTLLDLCGLPPREDLDGRSIAPLVQDP